MKKISLFLIFSTFVLVGVWIPEDATHIRGHIPTPTEFDINKSKRKDFKNQRKEYMKNMHRALPNVDWEKMDAESRKIRTDKVRETRQSLFYTQDLNSQGKQTENISRDLSGYWQERGSNNLAGRI